MSGRYGPLQCITDILLTAITESLADVGQGLNPGLLEAGADRLCESCGEQCGAALAKMEGSL